MKKIEPILDTTFSDILDMLQRIIIYYADPDSLGSFAKVSLDRRRKDSIQNGYTLFHCYEDYIPIESVEDVYDTTYDNKNGTYTECEIIVWDDSETEEILTKIRVVYPTSDCIVISIPKCYLDSDNPDKYPNVKNLKKCLYGEWINLIYELYDHFYKNPKRFFGVGNEIYKLRRLFISFGFVKSSYIVDIDTKYIAYPYTIIYKGTDDYKYYKAVIWTINNSAINWNDNSASENINKLLDGFDSYDVDYWADLIETIEEAEAFEENEEDEDVDEIVEEDISCND